MTIIYVILAITNGRMFRSTQQSLINFVQQLSVLQERMTRLKLELEQMRIALESRVHQGPAFPSAPPPCRRRQDSSPKRPGRLSQAVGQERRSFGKDCRLRG